MPRPSQTDYPVYYEAYISKIQADNILEILQQQKEAVKELLTSLPVEKENYRYAEGKWSVKELLGHIIDGERIFAYRALRFARNDKTELPGFNQDAYIENADFDSRTMLSLLEEFLSVRDASITLFKNLTEEELSHKGIANGKQVTVNAIQYIVAGHELHHMNILKERYL
jgi:uncharacterized damage-inducible protein DinB